MRIETDLKQYEPMALRLATYYYDKFGGKHDFQDLLAAAKRGIVEANKTFDPLHPKRAKFFTHAHNCARHAITRLLRSDTGVIYVPEKIPKNFTPPIAVEIPPNWDTHAADEDGFYDIDRKLILHQAIRALTPMQQKILRCLYVDQMSAAETAKALQVATNTVYAHLKDAQSKLKSKLGALDVHGWEDI
jgi:RNA polymerase sigma factor (sigma-70 family)